MGSLIYPSAPQRVDERYIQPSPEFKAQIAKVAGAILTFVVVYCILLVAAFLLTILAALFGFWLVVKFPKLITLLIGAGLIGAGGMILFFLVKFVFSNKKSDLSGMMEITEDEQPVLFAFIRQLAEETDAPFPKKVFLSPEVNASVFYHSSFWSMFFPAAKNLQIGLGLVNSVNISEFKAILAHEFGHFSQRSMKLGSYVYNVNQVIYNMLYENDGFKNALERWAKINGFFALSAGIVILIVLGIQWILDRVYALVNKQYLKLSRQMEFHADAVAASVAGSDPLITSLRRVELAQSSYEQVLERYSEWHEKNLKPMNFFKQHNAAMRIDARQSHLPVKGTLVYIDDDAVARFANSRVVIDDQWASHPSLADRESHLRRVNAIAETRLELAWVLFENVEEIQRGMTEQIFSDVPYNTTPVLLDTRSFAQKYIEYIRKYTFDWIYKGYYDNRPIEAFDVEKKIASSTIKQVRSFEELFNECYSNLPGKVRGLLRDIQVVSRIKNNNFGVKTFDFDGRKYKRKKADSVLEVLNKELDDTANKLAVHDQEIFVYFYRRAEKIRKHNTLKSAYKKYFTDSKQYDDDLDLFDSFGTYPMLIGSGPMSDQEGRRLNKEMKQKEIVLKQRLTQLANDPVSARLLNHEEINCLKSFMEKDRTYYDASSFIDENVDLLFRILQIFYKWIAETVFIKRKQILSFQATLVKN